MTEYLIKGAAHSITGFFSMESRLTFEGVQEAPFSKKGIRYHNFITAFFLRFFFESKIVDITDIDGNLYHLNRGDLSDWLIRNHDEQQIKTATKKALLNVSESWMWTCLNQVLEKKSPHYIVSISTIKNDLPRKEEDKRSADKRPSNQSLYEKALPVEIARLKQQLADAEAERAKNKPKI